MKSVKAETRVDKQIEKQCIKKKSQQKEKTQRDKKRKRRAKQQKRNSADKAGMAQKNRSMIIVTGVRAMGKM